MRADQIEWSEGKTERDWLAPIVADAEAGFGGPIHAFELMKSMIDAGASGVHFEDQLAAEKKCGHMGGKVLIPTASFVRTLNAARLATDVLDVPTVIVARTDALAATLITSDIDEARPRLHHRRAHDRRLLPHPERAWTPWPRARSRMRRMPTCSGARRERRISPKRRSSPRPSTRSSRARCSRTTARRRSTGSANSTRRRSRSSSASSPRWATSSSSSRWPAGT